MNPNFDRPNKIALTERTGLKLGALFLGAFAAVFVLSWILDLTTSYAAARNAEAAIVVQPAVVTIDPRIQTELARVMTFSDDADLGDIRDPFNDRTGISNIARNTGLSIQTSGTSGATSGTGAVNVRTGSGPPVGGASLGSAGAGPAGSEPTPTEATRLRYLNWIEQARLGAVQVLDPGIFAIEDLMPVGVVSGGDGVQEVMFFSQVAEKTLSFPVGTRFFDGWLMELRPEGVVFSFSDADRSVRLRSWSRSIKGLS